MKTKVTFMLDPELHQVVKVYAQQHHRSVTQVFVDYILTLPKEIQREKAEARKTSAGTSKRVV